MKITKKELKAIISQSLDDVLRNMNNIFRLLSAENRKINGQLQSILDNQNADRKILLRIEKSDAIAGQPLPKMTPTEKEDMPLDRDIDDRSDENVD